MKNVNQLIRLSQAVKSATETPVKRYNRLVAELKSAGMNQRNGFYLDDDRPQFDDTIQILDYRQQKDVFRNVADDDQEKLYGYYCRYHVSLVRVGKSWHFYHDSTGTYSKALKSGDRVVLDAGFYGLIPFFFFATVEDFEEALNNSGIKETFYPRQFTDTNCRDFGDEQHHVRYWWWCTYDQSEIVVATIRWNNKVEISTNIQPERAFELFKQWLHGKSKLMSQVRYSLQQLATYDPVRWEIVGGHMEGYPSTVHEFEHGNYTVRITQVEV